MAERKKSGRQQAQIDREQFEKLCAMQCTETEICGFFNVTDKTLMRWAKRQYGASMTFSDILKIKGAGGKISLRRAMLKNAVERNNAAVQIFLAKNMLGMNDRPGEIDGAEAIAKAIDSHNELLRIATTPAPDRNIEDFE